MKDFNLPLYFDYASTTPLDSEVLKEMMPYLTSNFGNASSSTHAYGWIAKGAVTKATKQICSFLNCVESEITFTSGATESINTALIGVYNTYKAVGNHIITVATEHKAVLDTCAYLESQGAEITYLPVNENGQINLTDLQNAITSKTIGICVMWVNNETGSIQPIEEIGEIAFDHKIPFICDASQAVGRINIDFAKLKIGLMPVSGHKIYGPKGVGLLITKRKNPRIKITPLIHGGGQQSNLRAGTLNVPGIVGIGVAMSIMSENMLVIQEKISNYQTRIITELEKLNFKVSIPNQYSVPNIINFSSPNIKATDLIKKASNIAFSLGSACNSENLSPSHVLKAMGYSDEKCYQSFRLSIGKYTTDEEVDTLISTFQKIKD